MNVGDYPLFTRGHLSSSRTDGDDVPRRRRVIPAPPDDVPSDADLPKLVHRDDAEHIQVRLK